MKPVNPSDEIAKLSEEADALAQEASKLRDYLEDFLDRYQLDPNCEKPREDIGVIAKLLSVNATLSRDEHGQLDLSGLPREPESIIAPYMMQTIVDFHRHQRDLFKSALQAAKKEHAWFELKLTISNDADNSCQEEEFKTKSAFKERKHELLSQYGLAKTGETHKKIFPPIAVKTYGADDSDIVVETTKQKACR